MSSNTARIEYNSIWGINTVPCAIAELLTFLLRKPTSLFETKIRDANSKIRTSETKQTRPEIFPTKVSPDSLGQPNRVQSDNWTSTMEPEAMKNLQLDKICRCCLTVKKEMRPLFGELIADMLTECAQVQVEKTDGWPDKVCMQCVQQISRFHSFKKKVELLDQQLREYIKGLTVIVEEQVSPELSLGKIELSGQQFLATTANGHHQVLQGGPTLLATTAYGQSVQIQSNGQVIPVHMLPGQRHVMQIKPPVSDESYEIIVPSESAAGTAIIHDNSPYYEDDIGER